MGCSSEGSGAFLCGKRACPLSLALLGSSPKGRALGSPRELHLLAKASPFGRGVTAGDGEGEDADRSAALSQKAALQMPFSFTAPPVKK